MQADTRCRSPLQELSSKGSSYEVLMTPIAHAIHGPGVAPQVSGLSEFGAASMSFFYVSTSGLLQRKRNWTFSKQPLLCFGRRTG